MRGSVIIILHIAILCQGGLGLVSGTTTTITPLPTSSANDVVIVPEGDDGGNVVLDPDKPSILANLERLQKENNQLRQDMQESQAQLMALVQGLQEDNSELRTQQANYLAMTLEMISEMSKEMKEHLQEANQQVQKQVSDLMTSVGEVRSQQEVVMQEAGMMGSVLEAVQDFEDEAHNVTAQLTHIRDRLMSVEASISQLQMEGSEFSAALTSVRQKMQELESRMEKLHGGQSSKTPSPPPPFTSSPGTSPWWITYPSPTTVPSPTTMPSPGSSTAVPQTPFTIPPDHSSDDSLITSILVTKAGKLILGDMHDSTLRLSQLDTPEDVEDVYRIHRPWAMVELQDGTIAVTMEHELTITVLKITGEGLSRVKDIPTERPYYAITQGPGNTLIVGSRREDHRTSSIDIIDMDGRKQRTLLQDVDFLIAPYCLRRFGDDVYVSDWVSSRVFGLSVDTGEVKFTLGDLDLARLDFENPRKFDIDGKGNLYIATGGRVCSPRSFCIIQVTQSGSWQEMEEYVPQNGGVFPYGLVVLAPQTIIISWCTWDYGWFSEVASYSLPDQQEESTPGKAVSVTSSCQEGCALRNVALHKPSLQSTYHPRYGHPERAVDGNTATAISQCTHTADIDSNPNRWWRVDLMGMFEVEAVRITNRGDCCGYRLSDFNIYVMESLLDPSERHHDPSDLCLHHAGEIPDGATVHLECDHPVIGQYVSLVLPTDFWPLHFCEIEVLGREASVRTTPFASTPESTPPSSSPQQSSTSTPAPWSPESSSQTTPERTSSPSPQSSSQTTLEYTSSSPSTQSSTDFW